MGAAAVKVSNNVTKTEVDDLRTDTTGAVSYTHLTLPTSDLV